MVNPIYPGGIHPVGGVPVGEKKSEGVGRKQTDKHYDQVQFSSHLNETEKRVMDTVSRISNEIRVRPTRQELDELQRQVSSGEYQVDPREIAARMLLLREDD